MTWDVTKEPGYHRQRLDFVKRPMWYTNESHDMQLPAEEQAMLARNILFDIKYEHDRHLIRHDLEEFYHSLDDRAMETIHGIEGTVALVASLLSATTVWRGARG